MRILKYISILSILLNSCTSNQRQPKADWEYIEVTYDDGWTGGSTVAINKDISFKKCYYEIISSIKNCSCYHSKLSKEQVIQINQLIGALRNSKVDSLYDGRCQDCGGYEIIVQYSDKTIKSSVIGLNKFNNGIDSLGTFVSDLPSSEDKLDSCEVFSSTKHIIPAKIDVGDKIELPPELQ
ncbi:hypothetical protein SAMN05661096_04136 [Marivirga sericea]|uniref:Uncharacterized protein n=1 Tax=Marivirga sericea TaxID=1028 RepID=A0A1X7LM27_9BACT|nr:hypothetical protein [Marivirga sericea]SMG54373.1 hypothetical protein SAMN05661096_04136 [Marivirga sericea]